MGSDCSWKFNAYKDQSQIWAVLTDSSSWWMSINSTLWSTSASSSLSREEPTFETQGGSIWWYCLQGWTRSWSWTKVTTNTSNRPSIRKWTLCYSARSWWCLHSLAYSSLDSTGSLRETVTTNTFLKKLSSRSLITHWCQAKLLVAFTCWIIHSCHLTWWA